MTVTPDDLEWLRKKVRWLDTLDLVGKEVDERRLFRIVLQMAKGNIEQCELCKGKGLVPLSAVEVGTCQGCGGTGKDGGKQ